ncbi:MAG: hypothetical protein IGR92_16500 [Leptolyngbyaceae cyanobacterium T60_A2020_046]|nr:hypothetical protein [Leptolyngbyaceae cyanobacterium T60_A2020_046]
MRSQAYWPTPNLVDALHHSAASLGNTCQRTAKNVWQWAIAHLSTSNEPHTWQSYDKNGNVLWNAYDPRTGQCVSKASVTELRIWLEKRYYDQSAQ